jgi:hypothetical protein
MSRAACRLAIHIAWAGFFVTPHNPEWRQYGISISIRKARETGRLRRLVEILMFDSEHLGR